MEKLKFIKEYPIRASVKSLYPFINTAPGLGAWFADKAHFDPDTQVFNFEWEGSSHLAKLTQHKLNKYCRYDFISHNAEENYDPNFIEFRLEMNELTSEVYLKVTDYSAVSDYEAIEDLWDGLIANLKDAING